MSGTHQTDLAVVVPPLSPSDTNPPLGPYLLRTCLEQSGLVVRVHDLSIAFLRSMGSSNSISSLPILGDQDKDRDLISRAKHEYRERSPLSHNDPFALPCCGNALLGMHYSFDDIHAAVEAASDRHHPWATFLDHTLFATQAEPLVLGFSIMGPPQVFVAMVAAHMARRRWPHATIVAGGSHITLLRTEIERDARYGEFFDAFLPGHCEGELAAFVRAVGDGKNWRSSPGVMVAGSAAASPQGVEVTIQRRAKHDAIELVPTFDASDLAPFDPARVTIPMQLSRGCAYGRCRMCTYPATEPFVPREPDWNAVTAAISTLTSRHQIPRFSFKDSFMTTPMLRRLSSNLLSQGAHVEWSATTMLSRSLTSELLHQLAASGCRTLEFGLETIWPDGQRILDKHQSLEMVEQVILDTTAAGIVANINLIYGLPGESHSQAIAQLEWFLGQQRRCPRLVTGSHNMLEINRAAPLSSACSGPCVSLGEIAPWAFSFAWIAPEWRPEFARTLNETLAAKLTFPSRSVHIA